jgi:hypothetical protein
MENSLIGDNATDCAGPQERFRSQGGNAVDDRVACNLGAPGDAIFAVAGTGFLPLTEVAGTWVNPLLPGHPAVDYLDGADRECGSPDDQRRVERPQGAGCDIGAFEADARTMISGETELELATVTPTASLTQGDVTAVLTSNARCRAGPGLVYDDYDFFTLGQSTQVFARLADSSWYQVKAPILPGMCWTGQSVLEFDVSPEVLLNLPVLRPPPTPTSAPVASAPNAPSGLQANEVACNASDGYRVKLTWSDNSGNESGFRIYHDGQVVATVGADVEKFTHTVPDDYGQQQSYRVEAYNDAGAAKSNTATEDGCLY